MTDGGLSLTREIEPEEADRVLSDGLDDFNAPVFGAADGAARYLVARDATGAVQGGVKYYTALDWLFVEWLWVSAPHRRCGEGARLMRAVETEAREAGCRGAYLDTFSFQAPAFYAKLGYSEFGRLPDFPSGYDRIWLMKRFS